MASELSGCSKLKQRVPVLSKFISDYSLNFFVLNVKDSSSKGIFQKGKVSFNNAVSGLSRKDHEPKQTKISMRFFFLRRANLHKVNGIEPRKWIDETAVKNKVSTSETNNTATDNVIELGEKLFVISVHNLLHHGC